jgi:hypothetical protein
MALVVAACSRRQVLADRLATLGGSPAESTQTAVDVALERADRGVLDRELARQIGVARAELDRVEGVITTLLRTVDATRCADPRLFVAKIGLQTSADVWLTLLADHLARRDEIRGRLARLDADGVKAAVAELVAEAEAAITSGR